MLHAFGDAVFYFRQRIVGEGVAEILHDVEAVSVADYAHPDYVVCRVQQVGAMRR